MSEKNITSALNTNAPIEEEIAQGKEIASVSLFKKRLKKFRSLKRGYYSFLILTTLYLLSFLLMFLVNNRALVVKYNGSLYFPIFTYHAASEFGQEGFGEAKYRALDRKFESDGSGNWVIMPIYPYDAIESLLDEFTDTPPHAPSREHWMGTDDRGRDVFARLAYGFRISVSFALLLIFIEYIIGISIGASLGFYGGKLDLFGQRLIELWSAVPGLYTLIILTSIFRPNFAMLVIFLAIFAWMGITYYIRGEFYREKAKDYVSAALAMGATDKQIIFRHILPNALTPVISFAPFAVVGGIGSLVALDYLGFGLPPPTPSWGQMAQVGLQNISKWWLVMFPLGALFVTLLLVVFIGEAVRNAFDPREYSRLR
ncbi:MAG: ABC transporter permease subunit [bacterium]|nr:ABC transporter permease subunit [bacterium]